MVRKDVRVGQSAFESCRISDGKEFQRTGAWQEKDLLVILRREMLAGRSNWHVGLRAAVPAVKEPQLFESTESVRTVSLWCLGSQVAVLLGTSPSSIH